VFKESNANKKILQSVVFESKFLKFFFSFLVKILSEKKKKVLFILFQKTKKNFPFIYTFPLCLAGFANFSPPPFAKPSLTDDFNDFI